MTVRWTVRAAEDRARSSRENQILSSPPKNNGFRAVIFLSKPQDWYIITVRSAVYIIRFDANISSKRVYYQPQAVSFCGLMIYNSYGIGDIQHFVLIICTAMP